MVWTGISYNLSDTACSAPSSRTGKWKNLLNRIIESFGSRIRVCPWMFGTTDPKTTQSADHKFNFQHCKPKWPLFYTFITYLQYFLQLWEVPNICILVENCWMNVFLFCFYIITQSKITAACSKLNINYFPFTFCYWGKYVVFKWSFWRQIM